jgi:hypothetical protein
VSKRNTGGDKCMSGPSNLSRILLLHHDLVDEDREAEELASGIVMANDESGRFVIPCQART